MILTESLKAGPMDGPHSFSAVKEISVCVIVLVSWTVKAHGEDECACAVHVDHRSCPDRRTTLGLVLHKLGIYKHCIAI